MSNQFNRVIYKPDTQSSEEFMVVVDPAEYKKWKDGDTSIPLSQVVDSFQIFHSFQGSQGRMGQASRQQLENLFGTSKDVDAVKFILEKGAMQGGYDITSDGFSDRSGQYHDTRGSNASTSGLTARR